MAAHTQVVAGAQQSVSPPVEDEAQFVTWGRSGGSVQRALHGGACWGLQIQCWELS